MRILTNTARIFPVVLVSTGFLVMFKVADLTFNAAQGVRAVSIAAAQDVKAPPKNQPPPAKSADAAAPGARSEEHTSELQSR